MFYVVRLEQTKSKIEIQQLKRKDIKIGILKKKKRERGEKRALYSQQEGRREQLFGFLNIF